MRCLGLKYNFEPKVDSEWLKSEALKCLILYQELYIYKTKLKSLEQMCIDIIPDRLLFKPKVSRSHLELPSDWDLNLMRRLIYGNFYLCDHCCNKSDLFHCYLHP